MGIVITLIFIYPWLIWLCVDEFAANMAHLSEDRFKEFLATVTGDAGRGRLLGAAFVAGMMEAFIAGVLVFLVYFFSDMIFGEHQTLGVASELEAGDTHVHASTASFEQFELGPRPQRSGNTYRFY